MVDAALHEEALQESWAVLMPKISALAKSEASSRRMLSELLQVQEKESQCIDEEGN